MLNLDMGRGHQNQTGGNGLLFGPRAGLSKQTKAWEDFMNLSDQEMVVKTKESSVWKKRKRRDTIQIMNFTEQETSELKMIFETDVVKGSAYEMSFVVGIDKDQDLFVARAAILEDSVFVNVTKWSIANLTDALDRINRELLGEFAIAKRAGVSQPEFQINREDFVRHLFDNL